VATKRVHWEGESISSSDHLVEGDYVELEISDTGCGMSPEIQARVFDPFFTTKSAGHGLGLAVVNGIVRTLGGGIAVTSELGRGTTFQVLLPIAEPIGKTISYPASGIETLPGPSRQAAVLVVEDESVLRQAVVKMLHKTGFEVLEAGDGSSAVDLLRDAVERIDVILLDVTIPGATSAEVVAAAARARPDVRVILTSAYSQERLAAGLKTSPVQGFIRKPFQFAELVKLLRSVVSAS
jgi:CheY-like chemotaxis protein